MNELDYRREQQDERQRDMRDEAKQAAKEAAADNTQPRHWITKVAGGRDAYDPISGDTHHVSDYCPSDEGCGDEED